MRQKISKLIEMLFGWGTLIILIAGGLSVVGFVVALIIGGETGGEIAVFLQKKLFNALVYTASILAVVGVIKMYISSEKALTVDSGKEDEGNNEKN